MTNKQEEKQLRDYKRVIDSIYLIMTCGIEEIPPKIKDAQTQFKIDYIRNRLNDIDKYCDNVYAYFFEEYNSVYVGRTDYGAKINQNKKEQCWTFLSPLQKEKSPCI